MEVALTRVEVTQVGSTVKNTLKVLPPEDKKKCQQKFVVGDDTGAVTCFGLKKEELQVCGVSASFCFIRKLLSCCDFSLCNRSFSRLRVKEKSQLLSSPVLSTRGTKSMLRTVPSFKDCGEKCVFFLSHVSIFPLFLFHLYLIKLLVGYLSFSIIYVFWSLVLSRIFSFFFPLPSFEGLAPLIRPFCALSVNVFLGCSL